jgi:hypothetical protein
VDDQDRDAYDRDDDDRGAAELGCCFLFQHLGS